MLLVISHFGNSLTVIPKQGSETWKKNSLLTASVVHENLNKAGRDISESVKPPLSPPLDTQDVKKILVNMAIIRAASRKFLAKSENNEASQNSLSLPAEVEISTTTPRDTLYSETWDGTTLIFTTPQFTADPPLVTAKKSPIFF